LREKASAAETGAELQKRKYELRQCEKEGKNMEEMFSKKTTHLSKKHNDI
jgi:hypothetical protein